VGLSSIPNANLTSSFSRDHQAGTAKIITALRMGDSFSSVDEGFHVFSPLITDLRRQAGSQTSWQA